MKLLLTSILILIVLVSIVQADNLNPPDSIKICGYITYCNETGIWWINPLNSDYSGTQIWVDDVYKTTVPPSQQGFYNINIQAIGDHTISTHTIDSWGNANNTWINITVPMAACPGYSENWFCDDNEWCIGISGGNNFTINAEVGETWIKYDWSLCNYNNVTVYIDGVIQASSSNFGDYYLTDLNPDEKHKIQLYNATNPSELLGSLTVSTLPSQIMIIILICVLIVFCILLFFLADPVKTILVGGLSASISLYTSQMALGYGALTILPLITLIISAIFIVYALWKLVIEKTTW